MTRNIVYFLGAGCSKNFGYPLTWEIMPEILRKLKGYNLFKLGDRKTQNERYDEKILFEYLNLLYPGLKDIDICKSGYEKIIPNITEVLSIVDHSCFYNQTPHPRINNNELLKFRELLNRAVVELLLGYEREAMNEKEETLFYKFIAPIKSSSSRTKVSVITTNYDLLLDWEFDDLIARNKIDYGISYRHVETSEIVMRNPKPRFNYFKLHGSLNWLRCDLCGQYYINPDGSVAALAFEPRPDYDNTCVCSDHLLLRSVLVAPSIVRDIRDSNLLQIWKAALEAIRTADEIIFVGYSLPPEDLAIRSLIMRGINGREKSKAKVKIDVIQMGEGAKNNYLNLFGKTIRYYAEGLPQYLNG